MRVPLFGALLVSTLAATCAELPRDPFTATLHADTDGWRPRARGAAGGPLRKRGVGSNLNTTEISALYGLSWFYNWGTHVRDVQTAEAAAAAGMAFVPMQWGRWGIGRLALTIQSGSHVILGMNEPNHLLQAALAPREAADLWPQLEAVADQLGLRLGSPAAAPCGAKCVQPDPFKWFDEFFYWCRGCRVDFLATHLYTCSVDWLRSYLMEARKYRLPIWLTEFACPNRDGSEAITWSYLKQALQLLDGDEWVERYAWFAVHTKAGWLGPGNSLLDQHGRLTTLGHIYLSYTPAEQEPAAVPVASSAGIGSAAAASGPAGQLQPAPASVPWSRRCQLCIKHLQRGLALEALPPAQRDMCSSGCGFWPVDPSAAAS